MKSSLDLGCGGKPKNPFNAEQLFGVDIRACGDSIKKANLVYEPIPFLEASFDYVTAYDFVEHVPRLMNIWDPVEVRNKTIYPFINLMNEVYRVLKLDGLFLSSTPAYPNPEAFQDPTHVNIITEKTFPLYFNDHYPVAHIYGFSGGFSVVSQDWQNSHLVTLLKKSHRPNIEQWPTY